MTNETKHLYNVVQHLIIALGYMANNHERLLRGHPADQIAKDQFNELQSTLLEQASKIEQTPEGP